MFFLVFVSVEILMPECCTTGWSGIHRRAADDSQGKRSRTGNFCFSYAHLKAFSLEKITRSVVFKHLLFADGTGPSVYSLLSEQSFKNQFVSAAAPLELLPDQTAFSWELPLIPGLPGARCWLPSQPGSALLQRSRHGAVCPCFSLPCPPGDG